MEHQDGYFNGVRVAQIYHQAWLPEGDAKAALVIVHGLGEHCGRYMNVVNHFVPQNYAVYGHDLYGHGKSDGPREFVESFDDYIGTLKLFIDKVAGWQPGKPLFMIGHSMGGLVGTIYLLDHSKDLAGAVISAPLVKAPDNISPITIKMSKLLSKVAPKFGVEALDPSLVSRDPQVVEDYINDPLVHHGKVTARLGSELLKSMQRVEAEANTIQTPLLIVQGGADSMVDPDGARTLFDTVSSPDKALKIFKGLHHEIFNEPEHPTVLAFVEGWLAAHII
jgi:acylglycerol lipase